MEGAALPAAP